MAHDDLYDQPELYDLVMTPNPAAEAFYIEEARRRRGAVLELACGSGRFSMPLARAGSDVLGGDQSRPMLERARAQALDAGLDIDFRQLDMRDFELPGRLFGLIVIAANSLLHLHSIHDLRACFERVARHLTLEGALAFDVFTPSIPLLSRDPVQRHLVGRFVHGRLGEVTVEETTDYDMPSQVSRNTWFWSTPVRPDFRVTPLHMRQIFPQELPLLLAAGGLRLTERFGEFDRRSFDKRSRRQVCIAEVA
jgi:SAM-dependent methyltransferase